MNVLSRFLSFYRRKQAGFFVLIDPEKIAGNLSFLRMCEENGVDGFLVGGSYKHRRVNFDQAVRKIKKEVRQPVIIFPGSAFQISKFADAILYLSLVSGRNPEYLIGEQVHGAERVKKAKLETIPVGYILLGSGNASSIRKLSQTLPIPFSQVKSVKRHALAAQFLGMRLIYLEAGSGAKISVPERIIRQVRSVVEIPLIVGGGIQSPQEAYRKVQAGANFVVIGNRLEYCREKELIRDFSEAIHLS